MSNPQFEPCSVCEPRVLEQLLWKRNDTELVPPGNPCTEEQSPACVRYRLYSTSSHRVDRSGPREKSSLMNAQLASVCVCTIFMSTFRFNELGHVAYLMKYIIDSGNVRLITQYSE